jgi:hypothetical protein
LGTPTPTCSFSLFFKFFLLPAGDFGLAMFGYSSQYNSEKYELSCQAATDTFARTNRAQPAQILFAECD